MLQLLLLLVITPSICAMSIDDIDAVPGVAGSEAWDNLQITFPEKSVHSKVPLKLMYDKQGFTVKKGDEFVRVPSHEIDKTFQGRDPRVMAKYALLGNKLRVREFDNGCDRRSPDGRSLVEYKVEPVSDLKGGGIIGSYVGAFAGKFVVHFIGHGLILIAGVCTGPAMPATVAALEATFLPVIEGLSMAAAVGGGVLGGVATGPV